MDSTELLQMDQCSTGNSTTVTAADPLLIGGHTVTSRLITGSGKYRDERIIPMVLEAAECEIITVAMRRVDFENPDENILCHIP